jgi:CHC2 zinc finger
MIIDTDAPERIERYHGVSYTKPIDAAKEAVRVIDLADRLAGPGKMRRVGETWATNCLLPNHEDRTPSFVIYPETDSWYCFSCLRGGDVVELYRLVHGFDQRDAHAAAGHLLLEFGHQPPERPPSWSRKQHRQKRTRDLIEEARLESMTRRLWRYVFVPLVEEIEDPEERKRMAKRLWPKVEANAKYLLAHRRGNR